MNRYHRSSLVAALAGDAKKTQKELEDWIARAEALHENLNEGK